MSSTLTTAIHSSCWASHSVSDRNVACVADAANRRSKAIADDSRQQSRYSQHEITDAGEGYSKPSARAIVWNRPV